MKPFWKTSLMVGLFAIITCMIRCSPGGGSSSSVEKAGGTILNLAGTPAQNIPVTMRPREYRAVQQLGKRIVENGYVVYGTFTDSKGRYSFTTDDSIREGVYCIEARDGKSGNCLFIDSIVVDSQVLNSDTPVDIKPPYVNTDNTLRPPGSLSGTIQMGDSLAGGMVFVYGLNTFARVYPDGSFTIENLPAGNLRLQVVVSQSGNEHKCLLTVTTIAGTPSTLDTMYGVFYNGNGNTGGSIPAINNLFDIGDTVPISGNSGNLERTGFSFAGWNTRPNGSGVSYNQGDTLIIDTAAKVFYAQWTITDIDGNVYTTVSIGNQTWLAENLRTTKFNDGGAIPIVTDSAAWTTLETPGYCWYDNNESEYKNTYGALYNWFTVNTGKLAPAGWHISTEADWDTLQDALLAQGYSWNGTNDATIAKALAANYNWDTSATVGAIGANLTKNNGSGFMALPGGCRYSESSFDDVGYSGYWWTTRELNELYGSAIEMKADYIIVKRSQSSKVCGYSVRCVLGR